MPDSQWAVNDGEQGAGSREQGSVQRSRNLWVANGG